MASDPREPLGRVVRNTFVAWAREQADRKGSWLVPWELLDAGQREVNMRIGEAVVRAYFPQVQSIEDGNRRIEDLRAFEREYRARLRAYHQDRVDELDGKDVPRG